MDSILPHEKEHKYSTPGRMYQALRMLSWCLVLGDGNMACFVSEIKCRYVISNNQATGWSLWKNIIATIELIWGVQLVQWTSSQAINFNSCMLTLYTRYVDHDQIPQFLNKLQWWGLCRHAYKYRHAIYTSRNSNCRPIQNCGMYINTLSVVGTMLFMIWNCSRDDAVVTVRCHAAL